MPNTHYERIARAIEFIETRAGSQPELAEIAAHVHLSPFHFQRLFGQWAGVTPKRFLQALTLERAKPLIDAGDAPTIAVADELGLSSGSRLQDHFVHLEAVTPQEYRRKGEGLHIRFGEAPSPFGAVFIAQTQRGICRISFLDHGQAQPLPVLEGDWPLAMFIRDDEQAADTCRQIFDIDATRRKPLSVLVRGSNFQIAVWRALLEIPSGSSTSYSQLASRAGRASAARAAGTAVGANPVAFLIPCHRVIRQSGALGGYRWGLTRKRAMHVWEAARLEGSPSVAKD